MTNEGKTTQPPRRVAISGASGLIGGALAVALEAQGHTVIRLVRGRPARAGELAWNPAAGEIDVTALEGVDAIVNLAGANVGAGVGRRLDEPRFGEAGWIRPGRWCVG